MEEINELDFSAMKPKQNYFVNGSLIMDSAITTDENGDINITFPNSVKRKNTSEYLESLPENSVRITNYNGHTFNRYWYDRDNERIISERSYGKSMLKIIKPSSTRSNCRIVILEDENKNPRTCSYFKLINYCKSL